MLIIRRPGAAVFTELLAANVSALIGTQWGLATSSPGSSRASASSSASPPSRCATVRLGRRCCSAASSAARFEASWYEWWSYWTDWGSGYKIVYLLCGVSPAPSVAGLGGWALVRYLARAGALDAFPAGQEVRESAAAR